MAEKPKHLHRQQAQKFLAEFLALTERWGFDVQAMPDVTHKFLLAEVVVPDDDGQVRSVFSEHFHKQQGAWLNENRFPKDTKKGDNE